VTLFGYELAHPWFGLAALAAPAAWWLARQGAGRVVFSSLRALPAGGHTWRTRVAWLPDVLLALAVVALAIALVGPRKGDQTARVRRDGIGIAMAVDVSGSMRAQDLAGDIAQRCDYDAVDRDPTRLGAVKRVFAHFVALRRDDAIGLVAFARYAETRSPLTLDHENLVAAAQQLDFARATEDPATNEDGTAIGAGLELAVERVADFKGGKVVVLLTDGASNVHDIDEDQAIDDAVKRGVRVYTIGAGTAGSAPICTPDGRLARIRGDLDENLLRKIADRTGGKFFRATDGVALTSIYAEIDRLERATIEEQQFLTYDQYYARFVVAALALIVAALVLRGTVLRRLP
jgi:Ca-activated chloride channel family protein